MLKSVFCTVTRATIMNEVNSTEKVTKISIENSSDFRFQAAYLAYSKAWTENTDEEQRLELNKIMQTLAANREDYSTFYDRINQFVRSVPSDYSGRGSFKAQNKRAWRRSEAKENRISRHRK